MNKEYPAEFYVVNAGGFRNYVCCKYDSDGIARYVGGPFILYSTAQRLAHELTKHFRNGVDIGHTHLKGCEKR